MELDHIIIGSGRSGTTSLVAYLKQHPMVNFSTIKEVTYFSVKDHYSRGVDFLHSFFTEREEGLSITSDTYLLMDKEAPKRLFDYNPEAKIAVILREPSERTYSNYNFSVNHGYINSSISLLDSQKLEEDILKNGDIVKQNNHCNFHGSLYHKHLSYWLTYFKRAQLFICTTNQLKENPQQLMNDYYQFLGLDSAKIKELTALNKAAGVKNKRLNKFLVNRDHPIRKLISKPLQISFLRNIIMNSNVVEKIKSSNKQEIVYTALSVTEKEFCKSYFKEDLTKLKDDFGIDFKT
jgi:hypothetical protein